MKLAAKLAILSLLGTASVPREQADVMRVVLADKDAGAPYCVTDKLGEPPFAGAQRGISENADREPGARARTAALREYTRYGWVSPQGGPLAAPMNARIVAAALALAEQGDPTPSLLEDDTVINLNETNPASQVEAETENPESAAGTSQADYGRVDRTWLAPGQRLGEDCPFPSLSLSAVALQGDMAFVDVGRVWAPLAGVGEIWVFERKGKGWTRIARRQTWIS